MNYLEKFQNNVAEKKRERDEERARRKATEMERLAEIANDLRLGLQERLDRGECVTTLKAPCEHETGASFTIDSEDIQALNDDDDRSEFEFQVINFGGVLMISLRGITSEMLDDF